LSENISVGKFVVGKCGFGKLVVGKICRWKNCVGKFDVGKNVSENLPSEKLLSEKPLDPFKIGKINFFFNKNFLKYTRLLKKNNRGCGCDTHNHIAVEAVKQTFG